jgi:aminoglycoside phosphotransferase (APT) family kinase protein
MAVSAKEHLPPALSEDSIRSLLQSLSLPSPSSITPLQVTAEFHSIYLLHFPSSSSPDNHHAAAALSPARTRNEDGSTTLVLRVSGTHIPVRKTLNEVAVMRYMGESMPSVPVPAVVRFDSSSDNVIGAEFTILEKVEGRSVDAMYGELDDAKKRWLVEQLTDVLLEMKRQEWHHIGGLRIDEKGGGIVPGPVLEDTFWMKPDVEKYFGPGESVETLNPSGPYSSHSDYITAYISCFIHAIEIHSSMTWLSDLIPRLRALIAKLPSYPSFNAVQLILSHKDLHYANVMALPSGKITGIIDWEFATVVPALRWDPVRAFLWDAGASGDESSGPEKERMRALFEEELRKRGVEKWWEGREGEEGKLVELVWTVVKFTRALVEVCPRGQRKDLVEGWKKSVEDALLELGV